MTILKLKTGFYGVHIANISKIVKKMIGECVVCKKKAMQFCKEKIGYKFSTRITAAE